MIKSCDVTFEDVLATKQVTLSLLERKILVDALITEKYDLHKHDRLDALTKKIIDELLEKLK